MVRSAGEMPFLDHLEELRKRILRSLLAVVGCFALGLWLVDRFRLLDVLKGPIAPLVPAGQLTVLSPTEPLMITLKLGFIVGLVLASPVILWQLWAFLSPALYEKEKKTLVPALFVGLGLFLGGALISFLFVVPQALGVLMNFQKGSFNPMITFDAYFSFVIQLMLALGISFELPLLMIILAALGILRTPMLNKIRPYAVVGSFVAGAILSPGADVLSMFMLTIPLLLLFEIGVAGVWVVQRRRLKAEAARASGAAVLLLCCLAVPARAQQPPPPPLPGRPLVPGQQIPGDTTRRGVRPRALDSASARRLGLPSTPKRGFPAADSIISQLLDFPGYSVTRYQADSASVQAIDRQVELKGNAMTERAGSVLEAAAIRYQEGACTVEAQGEPHLFQGGQVLIGASARFNTCTERGVIRDALTNVSEGGSNWFIRGNLAVDSSRSRLYGGNAELTSCDLPIPHYHFEAKQMKFVSKTLIVARPAVLYIRDVPIAWIPFIFQDTKPGRRSGILIPQFGFNDIVRTSRGYNRQITNLGYYWAPSDFFDAQVQLDWFNKRYLAFGITATYKIRNRFFGGGVSYSEQRESGGGISHSIDWRHTQQFNVSTTLNLDTHYSTNSQLVARNSIDPLVTTQEIRSQGNFTKRFPWGNLTAGLSRRETITNGSGDMTLPTLTLTPKPLDLGRSVTWSPGVSFSNQYSFKTPLGGLLVPGLGGQVDTIPLTGGTRVSSFNLDTPLRVGSFNLPLALDLVDRDSTGRYQTTFKIPDLSTPAPDDSVSVTQYRQGGFSSSFDWRTAIQLPILFRSTWKFSPSLGIGNSMAGQPFAVRNAQTGGAFVHQGKRLSLGASISPTFFAFLPGLLGVSKIRHSISPSLSYNYSPRSSVPEAFARAIALPGAPLALSSPASQSITLGLNQNFEGKGPQAPDDTLGLSVKKFRLLSIQSSSISYDFEQAKLPGRTGWTTSSFNNSLASDLVPGFTLNLTHNLWEGQVGTDSAKFKPFLENVSTAFSITENTLRMIGSLFGLAKKPTDVPQANAPPANLGSGGVPLPGEIRRNNLLQPSQSLGRGGTPFSANITVNISRSREIRRADGTTTPGSNNSSIGFNTRFSPTRFWGVTWSTQYNTANKQFESQQVQLTRDLHEWRAAFNFTKSPNGNFAFYFSVFLMDFPDINYKYNQTTIRP
ncbi:MAG TPA: twin-arginine translocase subunit TatC [Gemmatimonadales bacterium]|jgi:Tat protein translocase TatC|nr:twin-arginine translocase subunit TatC [Gemmatimonadales bacterium]